jgi:hypothetical protein
MLPPLWATLVYTGTQINQWLALQAWKSVWLSLQRALHNYNTYLPLVYNWLDAHSVLTQCLTHHGSPVRTGIQKHVTYIAAIYC